MGRVLPAFYQFFLDDGTPVVNGWLKFLESGTNNTLKNTYYDSIYQIPNANPLQLDGSGRCPNVFGQGKYRIISFTNDPEDEDSPGEQIQTFDPVTAQVESIESGGAGSFGLWDAAEEYSYGDIVTHSLVYYRSLADGNLGNLPPDTPEKWERVDFLRWWNETISYTTGNLVYYDDNLYLSEQDVNQNHQPDTSPAWWRPVATGYIEFSSYDEDYTVLPVDRDRILALDPAATTDRTFTLPAGDATTDQYRYGFYNCSATYSLTIHAPGSATLWIDGSDITLDHGAFLEVIYCADNDQWFPMSNVGPALGGQNLGTSTTPVKNAFVTALHIPSDEFIFFGDSDESQIGWVSADSALALNVPSGGTYDFEIDSVLAWEMATTGEFLPGALNPNPNVGSTTAPIGAFYTATGFLPDDGAIAFGSNDDLQIWHSGTQANIYNSTGHTVYTTIGSSGHYFATAAGNALVINSSGGLNLSGGIGFVSDIYGTGNLYLPQNTSNIYMGASNQFRLIHNGTNGYIDCTVGSLYIRTGATPSNALIISSAQDATLYGHLTLTSGHNIYFANTSTALIYYSSGLHIGTVSATNLFFRTNNIDRWVVSTSALYPVANATYNIGGTSNRVATTYSTYVNSYQINSPTDLVIGRADGAQQFQISGIAVTYFAGPPAYYQLDITIYSGGIGPFVFSDSVFA